MSAPALPAGRGAIHTETGDAGASGLWLQGGPPPFAVELGGRLHRPEMRPKAQSVSGSLGSTPLNPKVGQKPLAKRLNLGGKQRA